MKLPCRYLAPLVVGGLCATAAYAQEPLPIELRALNDLGQVDFDIRSQSWVFTNGVALTYSNAVLTADWGTASLITGEVNASGNVVLQQEGRLWRGESIDFNFRTGELHTDKFRTGEPPYLAEGNGLQASQTNNTYTATDVYLTTDDYSEPAYKIRAKSIKVVPGKYIEAKHATLRLGNVPVMYFPYYKRNLNGPSSEFMVTPGYRSRYGAYLLGSYDWYWNEKLEGTLNLDYRSKRGVGFGPDVDFNFGRYGAGNFEFYYLNDQEPGLDLAGNPITDNRHRFNFTYDVDIRTNLMAKVVVREQSDSQMNRDFFESDYRANPQPLSFIEVDQHWLDASLSVLAQPRLDDFYDTVERLPDIKLSAFRQQIGATPVYYEGETSIGYLQRRFADDAFPKYGAQRTDTYHQLLVPWTFFGWLNVEPRMGYRFTHYGETDGTGSTLGEEDRGVFNTGMNVSAKAWRLWNGVRNKFWDVEGVRHIFQPSVNYVYVPEPTKLPPQLPQFDRELPSLRLRPIDFPDYNTIDSIDAQNVLRLSLWNKLQTKRTEGIENLVNWGLYTDLRLDPGVGQSDFSDFYSDLIIRPRSWIIFNSQVRYSLDDNEWKEANHTVTFTPNNRWSWSGGHRFLEDDAVFGTGNNLLLSSFYYRFNENWGARLSHHFEARDGTMEEQYYTLYRDLRSFTTAITFRLRDNRDGQDDYTIGFSISLKAFPRFKLGDDSNRPSLLLDDGS